LREVSEGLWESSFSISHCAGSERTSGTAKQEDKQRASPLVRLSSLGQDDFEPQIERETVYLCLAQTNNTADKDTEDSLSEISQSCESTKYKYLQSDFENNLSENSNEHLLGNWASESKKTQRILSFQRKN
jgi:hypothetical protein